MDVQANALGKRVADFSLAVLRFMRALPRDVASDSIIRQVARSAAGVSANYRAACSAQRGADLVANLARAVEDADEADQWIWMASQLQLGPAAELARLAADGQQLRALLWASLSAARRHLKGDVRRRS